MTLRMPNPAIDIEALVWQRRRFLRCVERRLGSREDAEDIFPRLRERGDIPRHREEWDQTEDRP